MKTIDADTIAALKAEATQVARRRTHATLHDELSDPVQRVVIALQPAPMCARTATATAFGNCSPCWTARWRY